MGRPRQPLLSQERIFTEALLLIDTEGTEGLSVTRLARRLGVQAASLYNHVSGREQIVEGVRERVVAEIDASVLTSGPWRDALDGWARSYLAAFARHPNAIKLLAPTMTRSPLARATRERAAAVLAEAGWPADLATPALTAIESFVIGSALVLVAGTGPERAGAAFDSGLTALIAGLAVQAEGVRPSR